MRRCLEKQVFDQSFQVAVIAPGDDMRILGSEDATTCHIVVLRWIISNVYNFKSFSSYQGGITCGAIDEPKKSSKAIDELVIINFRDKNVVIARFCDKNVYRKLFCSIDRFSVLSKAFLFYP